MEVCSLLLSRSARQAGTIVMAHAEVCVRQKKLSAQFCSLSNENKKKCILKRKCRELRLAEADWNGLEVKR
jgi:hypothetical protein